MKKITFGVLAAAAVAAPIAAVGPASAAGAPVTTTHNIAVDVTNPVPTELPALNSQFKTMTIKVEGQMFWADNLQALVGYDSNGNLFHPYATDLHGGDVANHPFVLDGTQVGSVVYKVDGGTWKAIDGTATINVAEGKHVEVVVNDQDYAYQDNAGSYNVTVTRTKG